MRKPLTGANLPLTVALYQGITDETASTRALTAIIKS